MSSSGWWLSSQSSSSSSHAGIIRLQQQWLLSQFPLVLSGRVRICLRVFSYFLCHFGLGSCLRCEQKHKRVVLSVMVWQHTNKVALTYVHQFCCWSSCLHPYAQVLRPAPASAPEDIAPLTTRLAYILQPLFVYPCEGTE